MQALGIHELGRVGHDDAAVLGLCERGGLFGGGLGLGGGGSLLLFLGSGSSFLLLLLRRLLIPRRLRLVLGGVGRSVAAAQLGLVLVRHLARRALGPP
jgi:hypothetical protein